MSTTEKQRPTRLRSVGSPDEARVYKGIDRGPEWTALSRRVKNRDNWACVVCGSEEAPWACHMIAWSESPNLRYDLRNLMTLCPRCDPDRNHDIVFRRYPWLRRSTSKVRPDNFYSRCAHRLGHRDKGWRHPAWIFLAQLVAVWCVVVWAFVAELAVVGGITTIPAMLVWYGSMLPVTVVGVYVARFVYRRRR
jgi:hypothetical protein